MPTENGRSRASARSAAPRGSHASQDSAAGPGVESGHPASTRKEEEFRRNMEQIRAVLEAPSLIKLIEGYVKKVEAEPQQAKLNHDFRMMAHAANGKFYASNRLYFLVGLVICLVFLAVVIWLLKGDKETLLPIFTAVVSLLAGAGGGFIFGQSRRAAE